MQHPQEPSQFEDRQQGVSPETPFPEYLPMRPAQPRKFAMPVNSNPMRNPPLPFGFPPYPHEGAPYEIPRQDPSSEIGADQGSLLGFPPGPSVGSSFSANYPQPWRAGMGGLPFGQSQGGIAIDPRDAKGILTPQPLPLLPPPPPPPHVSHLNQKYYAGEHGRGDSQGYGWQHDNRDSYGSGHD